MSLARHFFFLSLALLCAIACGTAHAVQRAHVSAFGLDSNTSFNCDAAHPCRFLQAATTVVDPNGEVVVLDSGGFGGVTLTKSISLTAPAGVYAGISVFPGADGVTIATAGINVVLRGLTINGQGGNNGINMTAGAKLTVENCLISNMTQAGILVDTAANVRIMDTTIRDNGDNGLSLPNGNSLAVVSRSTISGNTNAGVMLQGTASVSNSVIAYNDVGISAFTAIGRVLASGNIVTNNSIGFRNDRSLAFFDSAGNNAMSHNTFDTFGFINLIGMK